MTAVDYVGLPDGNINCAGVFVIHSGNGEGRSYRQTEIPHLVINANIVLSGWTTYSFGLPIGKHNCAYVFVIHSARVEISCEGTAWGLSEKT